jgi:hypothetical protein
MNVQDRVFKALDGDAPDRIPIFVPGYEAKFLEVFDAARGERVGSKICIVNEQDLTPLAHLGVDLCEVQGPPRVKQAGMDLPALEDASLQVDMHGRVFRRKKAGNVDYLTYQGPFLRTEDQVRRWKHVVPGEIEPGWYDRVYKETLEAVDNHAICPVFKACDGLYSTIEEGIGIENMAVMLHDRPALIDAQLENAFKVVESDVKALLEARIALIVIRDNITVENKPRITPDLVQQHLFPIYKKLVDMIHEKGGKVFFKTSGDVLSVAQTLIAARFDAVHIMNPEPTYLEEFCMTWGDKTCAIGNLDVSSMLSQGMSLQVQKRAKELVDIAKGNGRYIFGTNDLLLNTTKLDNVEAMIRVVQQKGIY